MREIFARTRTPGFQRYLRDLLVELCAIDTTPNPDVKRMQAAEDGCFRILERELGSLRFPGARLNAGPSIPPSRRTPITRCCISPRRPSGRRASRRKKPTPAAPTCSTSSPAQAVAAPGQSVALNAHIDVVAPYFPPRVKGGTVLWPRRVRRQRPGGQHRRRAQGAFRGHAQGRAEVEPERGGDAGGRGGNRRQRLPLARH